MAEVYREVRTDNTVNEPVAETTPVANTTPAVETSRKEHRINVAERLIYLIGGILLGLLGIRFLLRLLAANPANGFADFIYTVTHPFVAPFFGLFNYNEQFGASRFEFETLIAMVVYALVIAVIARLAALPSRRADV
jgi:YggT family protein